MLPVRGQSLRRAAGRDGCLQRSSSGRGCLRMIFISDVNTRFRPVAVYERALAIKPLCRHFGVGP
jgi:hypothetical protein